MKSPLLQFLVQRFAAPPYQGAAGLVVAVSGGVDSMVLLDVVLRLRHIHGAPVRAFHCDHRTGRFARVARDLVRASCAEREVPLVEAVFEAGDGANFEFRAAAFRRARLAGALQPGEFALLAHHAGDQMETMLLALCRGARVASPLAMAPHRNRRLRPLLDVTRATILAHAAVAAVPHVQDSSNYDPRFQRNYLRQEVVPRLAGAHEAPWIRWSRWAASFTQLQDQLNAAARDWLDRFWIEAGIPCPLLRRGWWQETPDYLQEFVLAQWWARLPCPPPINAHHEQLIAWFQAAETGSFQHEGGVVYCDRDGLTWWPALPTAPRFCHWDEWFDWGPWRWRFSRPSGEGIGTRDKQNAHARRTMAILRGQAVKRFPKTPSPQSVATWHECEGLFVSLPDGLGPRIREWYRTERFPRRLRGLLPNLACKQTGAEVHFVDFLAQHPQSVHIETRK
ncbi:tRNA lysidine(34) synthetase TilS [Acanthopleuribacter pedis]|uniref:tRNA(Ile)-lysidine synthase n=1 Tax=Acanthopleuribacter pedis TaxID=442870 RepID=A0A8J7QK47_9BACT|nr:tRNA lysidine(34) synthetase TilS [Acanthopleuribacter pedis]MBO1319658.1 tRNA lysidine(34) synthetase TilS [Acanthopleuribacter pedis]